jgi:sugar-specific transcriptional regulator TrmB
VRGSGLGEETITKILRNLELTEKEAEVYVFLSKHGVLKCSEIAKGMKRHKAQIYRILKILQTKGLVEPTLEAPARFTAVPFERVLDLSIKAKRDEAAQMETTKNEILTYWKTIRRPELEPSLQKFVVIEGNSKIYTKIAQMIKETKTQLSAVATIAGLLRADQFGLFDNILIHPLDSKIEFRFLTDLSSQSTNSVKNFLKKMPTTKISLRDRRPEMGMQLSPRMVIQDEEEALFFITPRNDASNDSSDEVCLWTDCKELVLSFASIFEGMWRNSPDVTSELATPRATRLAEAQLIDDEEEAKQKYADALRSADKEIIFMTSARGLKELSQDNRMLSGAIQKGVVIRIMAPVIDENQDAAKQLSERTQVRHIEIGDLGTTIIDGKHIFQFKDMSIDQDMSQPMRLGKLYYSDDFEYVNKMKTSMEDIWTKAPVPSYNAWELSFGPPMAGIPITSHGSPSAAKKGKQFATGENTTNDAIMNETGSLPSVEYVKEKWENYIRTNEPAIARGWRARAIIRLPNLPKTPMIGINIIHLDDDSAFGGGKMMEVDLWMETPLGYSFVPVACVVNTQGSMVMQRFYAGTPAARNMVLVEPHKQLEIFRKDNLVFAGWTVDIPLPPLGHSLGPSCLFFEGHGSTQQLTRSYSLPTGFKSTTDFKKCHAFVTFMNQSQPYVATGIQGFLVTEYVMRTTHP